MAEKAIEQLMARSAKDLRPLTKAERAKLLTAWNIVIELKPERGEAYGERGLALIQTTDRVDDGKADLKRARELSAHRKSGTLLAMAMLDATYERHEIAARRFTEVSRIATHPFRKLAAAVNANRMLRLLKRYEEALAVLLPLEDAGLSDVDNGIAITYQKLGRHAEAIAAYRRAIEREPDYLPSRANLIGLLLQTRQHGEALRHADALCRTHPDSATAHRQRARVLLGMGRKREALKAYSAAVNRDPKDVEAWIQRISLLSQLGAPNRALGELDDLLTRHPNHLKLLQLSVAMKTRLELEAEAEADLRVLLRLQWSGTNVAALAMLVYRQRKHTLALAILDDGMARARKPVDIAPLLLNKGSILYQMKSYAAASATYEKLVRYSPGVAYFGLGQTSSATGDRETARKHFDASIAAGYVRSYYSRGLLRMQQKDREGAIADFRVTVQQDPPRRAMALTALKQLGEK